MYNALIQKFLRASPSNGPAETKKFCRRLVANMIERASIQFGVPDMPLAIDETRIAVAGYPNIREAIGAGITPDLDRFWDLLSETYEPTGVAMAYRQAATTLVDGLHLTHPSSICRTARTARMRLLAESESAATDGRPFRRLTPVSLEPVGAVVASLVIAARQAGAWPLAGCLRQFDYGEPFLAQRRRTFPELDVVQFNEYWEFRFDVALADRLMQFVSQHAGIPACRFSS
ncbi:hypothetical protein LMG23992_04225 [Cupriavidus laharis]|uniref:Transposase n=1 Tax=Cupriavidus laharis TaxID=151654 RepID=A0ABN7Z7M8_9BURK|nr:hypothetical protein [Cupriavidus laharis]CAG9180371.1 hypothetical protein LMG23992_04225 [Cupriavidus laharis]